MRVLVTGGAGYIGTHTLVELIKADHKPVVIDNLSNSNQEAIHRVEQLTSVSIPFYNIDLQDKEASRAVFDSQHIDAVVHFAGLKAVGESVEKPLLYYRNNIDSTLTLLELMSEYQVKHMVFSSSATVYGSSPVPYSENNQTGHGITNPYGRTKYMIEQIIQDTSHINPDHTYTVLRYFNPVGAHESGLIGEDPKGKPNNLMPFIAQVASGRRDKLSIFGNDYDTPDGTCIRDYIHVVDLAKGHVAALLKSTTGYEAYNLGSGVGTSVLELVNAFIEVTGQDVPYVIESRRSGDLPQFYANPGKALKELSWKTQKSVEDMCRDTWRWQSNNPTGYHQA